MVVCDAMAHRKKIFSNDKKKKKKRLNEKSENS